VNRGTIGVNSFPKTVTRQRRGGCDLNPGASAPESSMLTTRATRTMAANWQRSGGGGVLI